MPIEISGTSGITFPDSTIQATSGLIPSGAVTFFAMSTAPTGWIKANGAAVSRSTYSALFSAIGTTFGSGDGSTTFNLPDMRGYFPRGFDDGRGVDSGRGFGSNQTDQFQAFRIRWGQASSVNTNFTTWVGTGGASFFTDTSPALPSSGDPFEAYSTFGTPRFGSESRGINIALLACIKF